jgi:hypothetical protein
VAACEVAQSRELLPLHDNCYQPVIAATMRQAAPPKHEALHSVTKQIFPVDDPVRCERATRSVSVWHLCPGGRNDRLLMQGSNSATKGGATPPIESCRCDAFHLLLCHFLQILDRLVVSKFQNMSVSGNTHGTPCDAATIRKIFHSFMNTPVCYGT